MKNAKSFLVKPSRESQPWAIWIWNLAISKEEMVSQLTDFASKGFGGVIIKASRDMTPAYLSREFIELFTTAVQKAQDLGIGVRLGTDFSINWNTGLDSILNQYKELRAHYLTLVQIITPSDGKHEIEIVLKEPSETILLAAKFIESVVCLDDVKQLTTNGKNSVLWKVPGPDWKVLVLEKHFPIDCSGSFVPNLFNSRIAQVFTQSVLEPCIEPISKFIPNTFEGLLLELPSLQPYEKSIPWDDEFVARFKAKYKKDLVKLLPALFFETTPTAHRTRIQVYEFIHHTMHEKFTQSIEQWVKKNHLTLWTLFSEKSIEKPLHSLVDLTVPVDEGLTHVGFQNQDVSKENIYFQKLINDINTIQCKRLNLSVLGRNKTGNAGTIHSIKAEFDKSISQGISKVIIDGAFFNADQRSYVKTPYNLSWYSPEWEHVNVLTSYISKTNECIKDTFTNHEVAVISPTPYLQASYVPEQLEAMHKGVSQFVEVLEKLDHAKLEYDCVQEDFLLSFEVHGDGTCGPSNEKTKKGPNYKILIVPCASVVSRSLLVFIEKFIAKEGIVFFIEESPRGTYEDGFGGVTQTRVQKILASKKGSARVCPVNDIETTLADFNTSGAQAIYLDRSCPDIIVKQRLHESHKLFIFHNQSENNDYTAIIELPSEKHYFAIDCEDSRIFEIQPIETEENRSQFSLNFGPLSTYIIVSSPTQIPTQGTAKSSRGVDPFTIGPRNYRIMLKEPWEFKPLSYNAFPLSNWNIRIGLSRESGGFSHFFESFFQAKIIPDNCFFVLCGMGGNFRTKGPESILEICVNGTRVDKVVIPVGMTSADAKTQALANDIPLQETMRKWFGPHAMAFNIKSALMKGMNRISFRSAGMIDDPQSLIYPMVIVGDFALSKGTRGWSLDKDITSANQDSWTKSGYPYLTGKASYRQTFEIPHEYKRLLLRFSNVSGIVHARLNDKDLGNFYWHPMEIDITEICEQKRNELTIAVVNTIDNILKMNGRASGLTGGVFIDVY